MTERENDVPEDGVSDGASPDSGAHTGERASVDDDAADRRALAEALKEARAVRGDDQAVAPMRGRPVMPRTVGALPPEPAPDAMPEDAPAAIPEDAPDEPEVTADESDPPVASAADPYGEPDHDDAASGIAPDEQPDPDDQTDAVPVASDDDPDDPSSLEAPVPLDELPALTRRRAITRRGVLVVGGRALAGVAVLVAAAVVITGATVSPELRYSITPPQSTITPVAAPQQRVCPGPLLRLGDDEGQGATSATSLGRPSIRSQGSPGELQAGSLEATENTAGVAPVVLTLPPTTDQDAPPAIAGSQSQRIDSGDLVGMAAAQCAEPGGDIWLVGGSTDVGRTTLITLSNPTTVPATVEIDIFGPAGEVVAPGASGIVVPPGAQRVFSLAGFAPQLAAPVLRVQSRGGLVVANLQQSVVRTLDPGGVAIVGAGQGPTRITVLPGVVVATTAEIAAAQQEGGFEDLPTAIRLFVPGETPARATVAIRPEQGAAGVEGGALDAVAGASVTPGGFELDLPAGQVTELSVPGLAAGTYTVTIESDVPIVAGARVSTLTAGGASDLAWIPSAQPLMPATLVSTAPAPSAVLHLANPTDEPRSIEITGGERVVAVELAPGSAAATELPADEDFALTGAGGLRATVTYSADGVLAAATVTAPGAGSGDIVVYR